MPIQPPAQGLGFRVPNLKEAHVETGFLHDRPCKSTVYCAPSLVLHDFFGLRVTLYA